MPPRVEAVFASRALDVRRDGRSRPGRLYTPLPDEPVRVGTDRTDGRAQSRNRLVHDIHILRWGEPYESLNQDEVSHFATGEPLARVGQAIPGLISRDMRKAQRARDVLREASSSASV